MSRRRGSVVVCGAGEHRPELELLVLQGAQPGLAYLEVGQHLKRSGFLVAPTMPRRQGLLGGGAQNAAEVVDDRVFAVARIIELVDHFRRLEQLIGQDDADRFAGPDHADEVGGRGSTLASSPISGQASCRFPPRMQSPMAGGYAA